MTRFFGAAVLILGSAGKARADFPPDIQVDGTLQVTPNLTVGYRDRRNGAGNDPDGTRALVASHFDFLRKTKAGARLLKRLEGTSVSVELTLGRAGGFAPGGSNQSASIGATERTRNLAQMGLYVLEHGKPIHNYVRLDLSEYRNVTKFEKAFPIDKVAVTLEGGKVELIPLQTLNLFHELTHAARAPKIGGPEQVAAARRGSELVAPHEDPFAEMVGISREELETTAEDNVLLRELDLTPRPTYMISPSGISSGEGQRIIQQISGSTTPTDEKKARLKALVNCGQVTDLRLRFLSALYRLRRAAAPIRERMVAFSGSSLLGPIWGRALGLASISLNSSQKCEGAVGRR